MHMIASVLFSKTNNDSTENLKHTFHLIEGIENGTHRI
jgi:hypothetical protein